MLMAGDVGGTKTDLAIYSAESGHHAPLAQIEFHSQLAGDGQGVPRAGKDIRGRRFF